VGERFCQPAPEGFASGGRGAGHHGWIAGTGSDVQALVCWAQTQRCQKHAKANACRRVRAKEREAFSKDVNKIFYASSASAARVALFALMEQWGWQFPTAVQILERDLDSLLTLFQFDPGPADS
jgi:transposase-like protein